MKKILILTLALFLTSCNYKLYVNENENGRRELKKKSFENKFERNMSNKIDFKNIYSEYSSASNAKYTYLRLFATGQYAMFYQKTDDLSNLNKLENASHVGYYIIDKDVLKLETPTGNGNTFGYRIVKTYQIKNDTLVEYGSRIPNDTLVKRYIPSILNVTPDW